MQRLTHRDLCGVIHFLASCDASGGLHEFAVSVTNGLPALISADVTVFALANLRAPSIYAIENPRVTSPADLETYMHVSQEASNPLIDHFGRTSDPEARRMSDFVSHRQFHDHPLYTEFYRRMRLESILGTPLNDSPTAFDGITLNRDRRDFTERDRTVLTVLRPHIIHGYRTALAVDRLRADLLVALQAIETPGFGLVVLDEGGRMRFVSPGAVALLASYFGARRHAHELPDLLGRWVRDRVDAARDASKMPPLPTPFVAERNGTRLVVRLLWLARNALLLLEEPDNRPDWLRRARLGLRAREADTLCGCLREAVITDSAPAVPDVARRLAAYFREVQGGAPAAHNLTPHEARILRLLVEGHSYKTAAAVLGSSVHTVAFHVKRIYGKLQVHSKSEAVARALRDGLVQ